MYQQKNIENRTKASTILSGLRDSHKREYDKAETAAAFVPERPTMVQKTVKT